jgi:hypothetical protein
MFLAFLVVFSNADRDSLDDINGEGNKDQTWRELYKMTFDLTLYMS